MYTINLNEDDLFVLKIALNSCIKRGKEIIADKEYKIFIESLPPKSTIDTDAEKVLKLQESITVHKNIIEGSNKIMQIINNIQLNK
jgi:hypothetical protein